MYTNYARWFCKEATGHDKVWPEWANGSCPECGGEFELSDRILTDDEDVVHHYDCYRGPKPPFEYRVVT